MGVAISAREKPGAGRNVAAFAKPAALAPFYGGNSMGYTLFARFSLGD